MTPVGDIAAIVRSEFQRRVRAWKRSLYAGAAGALLLLAALVFALIAVFLFLADAYGPPAAALIMAAGLLLLAFIAFIIASMKTQRRNLKAEIQSVAEHEMHQLQEQLSPQRVDASSLLTVLGAAFAIGLLAGRRQR